MSSIHDRLLIYRLDTRRAIFSILAIMPRPISQRWDNIRRSPGKLHVNLDLHELQLRQIAELYIIAYDSNNTMIMVANVILCCSFDLNRTGILRLGVMRRSWGLLVDGRSGDVVVGGALDDMMVVVSVESLKGKLWFCSVLSAQVHRKKQSTMMFLAVKEACRCWQADGTPGETHCLGVPFPLVAVAQYAKIICA